MPWLTLLLLVAACSPLRPLPSPVGAEAGPGAPGRGESNCSRDYLERFAPGPISPGPLRFESVACLDFGSSPYPVSDPILSPDGTAAAKWHGGDPAAIEIASLARPGRVAIPNRVAFRSFAFLSGTPGSDPDALAWSSDSRSLWSVRQKITSPGGWALGGLEPIAIARDGTVRPLPALRHPAGPLDGLRWVGGRGLALALFGTRGGYYRPERSDRDPTLAMVDAARGRVLASVSARTIPALRRRLAVWPVMVAGATATSLADGRIRTVIRFGRWAQRPPGAAPNSEPIIHPPFWLSWTQGEPPRSWPSPYPGDEFNQLALVPGGERLLVLRPAQPDGVQISCRAPPCPKAPPPIPATRRIAELIEVSSRRVLWRLSVRAESFWNEGVAPAVSGDGRFAMIALPPRDGRLPVGLVDMRSGRILQTISPTGIGSSPNALGFTADGRRAWIGLGNTMQFYALGRG